MRTSSYTWKFNSLLLSAAALCAFAAGAGAQTLTIVSGNGQVVGPASSSPQQLVVNLLNTNGQPFPGQTVFFTTTQTGQLSGNPTATTAVTDANGNASVGYIGAGLLFSNIPYVGNQVIASYGASSVTFIETTSNFLPNSSGLIVTGNVIYPSPNSGIVISGAAGSTGSTPIQINVTSILGNPFGGTPGIPGVALSISTDASSTGSISCKEGPFVLTDSNGNASCTPLFGKTGIGTFTINIGGQQFFGNNQFTVGVGNPSIITISSGNNQAGAPGSTLPLPIVGIVMDAAGNVLSGVQAVFTSLTPGGATFTNVRNSSDANGRVSATVVLGSVAGAIQIQISDAGGLVKTPAVFTETVNINVSGLTKISGDTQTTFINQPFGGALIVQANSPTSQPVQGATVQFAVTGGSATVSPATAITGANGQASANVTAGPNAGTITVTATINGVPSVTFTLTANPPGPTNFSYYNGASGAANSVSPGSVVTITAQGLVSNSIQGTVSASEIGPLSYTVAGVSITLNNIPVPIFNVSNVNGQQSVTVQIPYEVPATTVPIKISASGGSTNAALTVNAVSPGFFSTVQSDGVTRAIALRPNGTVVGPGNPAARGENVRVYMTGLGPVSPAVPTGTFSPSSGSDPVVTSSLIAGINNGGVPLVQAIYARNLIGVYELTITVPPASAAPSGSVPLSVAVQGTSGYVYSNASTILIQ